MNKLLTTLMLLAFLSANAQEKFTFSEEKIEEGVVTKRGIFLKLSDFVILYSDGTPDELFNKTKVWIKENFVHPEDKILSEEKGGHISFQANTKTLLRTHHVVTASEAYQGYRFSIDIKFKYGRFLFQPTSLKTYTKDESLSSGWREQGYMNAIKDYKGNEIIEGQNDIKTQIEFFNKLANSLKQHLDGGIKVVDEDW